jgi:alkylation response protein AidB-like acyl-CoA dehydrogenase
VRYVSSLAQDALRTEARAFLADASPSAAVRRLMETDRGYDPAVWDEIVARGWPSLAIADLAVVVEEAGAALLCAPLLGTAAARAAVGDRWDPGAIVAVALAEDSGRWEADAVTLAASPSAGGGGWTLDGHKSFIVDGWVADTLLVAGRTATDGGVALFVVDGDAPGVDHTRLATVDLTRQQTRVELSATPGRLVGDEDAFERLLDVAATLLAAEQVGGARRCLDMTVAHVSRRVQFGRPIGSFQAVQHRCADMLLELESARSASAWATHAAASEGADFSQAAATAQVVCSEAYAFIAAEAIHLHGGLGFTWDHDAHLYFKRAKSSRLLFGDPRFHRERLFRDLGL